MRRPIAAILALSLAPPILADIIPIANSSFESPNFAPALGTLTEAPTAWEGGGGQFGLIDRGPSSPWHAGIDRTPDAADFEQLAFFSGGYLFQVLPNALAAFTTYTLAADVGDTDGGTFGYGDLQLGYGATYSLATFLTPATAVNPAPSNGAGTTDGWVRWTCTFQTGAGPAGLGQPLMIAIGGGNTLTLFDNLSLTATPTPAPGALSFVLLGLLPRSQRRATRAAQSDR
ncbi:hypothetical protein PHYC_03464 [Phycisphaerales bacterium]|nr:hypothetical protein PHYC_03464 [Phycisphaerales bacterium]